VQDVAPPFVHLHVHTEYSLVDGLLRIKPMVKAAAEAGMPAIAVTDQANLFCLVRFYKEALRAGIKPIAGTELWVRNPEDANTPYRLVVLVQDRTGYLNLTRLISRGYLEGQHLGVPQVERDWVEDAAEGLVALSGGPGGDVGRALLCGNRVEAERLLEGWLSVFGDRYYLELIRSGREDEADCIEQSVALAAQKGVPVVATNDVRFLEASDFDAHEVRVCIHDGRTIDDPRRPRLYSEEQYLRTPEEMSELFSDIPEALENTLEIAKRCNLELTLGKNYLPDFPIPEGMSIEEFFAQESRKGLEWRLERILDRGAPDWAERRREYDERLQLELDVINQMGFPGYFLIVADFIQWAKDSDIPVGPGRGSGAGSLVAYALKITDLDPIEHDLLFERFLNPERVSMPDFDVDFCMENRDKVIDYVAGRYGRDAVSQIITFGTMAAKAVVRDVGRVLGHPYGMVDRIAKMVPFELGMTLEKALEESEELKKTYAEDEEVRAIIDMARKLEGVARNAGKHAGGVVIAPTRLTDFAPLYCEPGGDNLVTQYDKDDVEQAGLVKFDFLGLRTLTIIDWALKTINAGREQAGDPPIDIAAIDPKDPDAFALLKRCETTAVFQLESRGMKELIKKLRPDSFDDMTALVALFRPGPLQSGMVDDFIARKHGEAEVAYPHPDLEPILKPTYGVILYQEQVMQIAQVLAGYSLGGADLLRRAMGKKKQAEMDKQRAIFEKGAAERGVEAKTATYIFDLMDKFAGYGFNKCVHGDTRVMDAETGRWHRVEDLFRNGERPLVHALDDRYRLVPRRVQAVVWNGVKPVYRLRVRNGKEILATGNHPFRTVDGWTNLEDLAVGDHIASARRLDCAGDQIWREHELIVLAGLLGEGNTCHPANLFFYSNDDRLIDDFARAAKRFDNTVARISCYDGTRKEVCLKRARCVPWNSPEFEQNRFSGARIWAQDLGIIGKRATEKDIPEPLFRLPVGQIALFVGRLWSGDGSLGLEHTTLYYETSSVRLADGLARLLLRLGIQVRIHEKRVAYRGGYQTGYAVHLVGKESLRCFVELVLPRVVGRADQVDALRVHDSLDGDRSSRDTIPASARIDVGRSRVQHGWTWKELEQRSGLSMKEFCGRGSAGKLGFRRSTVAAPAATWEDEHLLDLAASDLYWDRVESIEYVGDYDTYDLRIEEHHNFVAEGIVVHNSHSAAYALVSYQTLWLKAHYPAAFMAAVLSADMDNTDKVVTLIDECREMKLVVLPPAVNRSQFRFTIADDRTVVYGIGAIKGVGESAIEAMLEARQEGDAFRDLWDFCRRIDLHKANRRVLEALIRAGALDELGKNRATLMEQLPMAIKLAEQHRESQAAGQVDLFGMVGESAAAEPDPQLAGRVWDEWEEEERLQGEKETLGLYLTGHPVNRFDKEINALVGARIGNLLSSPKGRGDREPRTVVGLVVGVRHGKTQRGRMGSVVLDDRTGRMEVTVFSELYEQARELLAVDRMLAITGTLSFDDYRDNWSLRANEVRNLEQAREAAADHILIEIDLSDPKDHATGGVLVESLREILSAFRGGAMAVQVVYRRPGARARLVLGEDWRVQPTDELLKRLRHFLGADSVHVSYQRFVPPRVVVLESSQSPRLAVS
jgi:DNA polymerase-3 subunit alpha